MIAKKTGFRKQAAVQFLRNLLFCLCFESRNTKGRKNHKGTTLFFAAFVLPSCTSCSNEWQTETPPIFCSRRKYPKATVPFERISLISVMVRLLLFFLLLPQLLPAQPLQKASSGKIVHMENVPSKYVEPRNVDIWLPPQYDGKKRFAVLYMHDGQMLFDSTTTWNHHAWDVDDVAAKLMAEGRVQDFIVVGIWNAGARRHANYFPQKPFDDLSQTDRDSVVQQLQRTLHTTEVFQPNADGYLKFLVEELKPQIDRSYSVYTDKAHTFIAGSSMGGLISLYAICQYPAIFGGAACLSTHWLGTFSTENNPVPDAFCRYLQKNLPSPKTHKLYFDCGDQTLDAFYPPIQKRVDSIMAAKGFTAGNWLTRYFPGEDHSERSWHERLSIPLLFLLGK